MWKWQESGEEKATGQYMIKSGPGNGKKMVAQFRQRPTLKKSNTQGNQETDKGLT